MKQIAVLLIAILASVNIMAAEPDFAYPKTSLKNAIKEYDQAMKNPSRDGQKLIGSILQITGATAAIDTDSVPSVLPRVDRAIDAMPDGADKALMMTVKAELINSIYSANRWKYDRTETPDEPLPADITEWNGRQFSNVASSLIDKAFNMACDSPTAPLSAYSHVIKADHTSLIYFPDVTSFIALKAQSVLSDFNLDNMQRSIINRMIDMNRKQSAPWFYWSVVLCREYPGYSPYASLSSGREDWLVNLYLENKDCEQAGYVLDAIAKDCPGYDSADSCLIPEIKSFIARYPAYWQINNLKNSLARLTQSIVSVNILRTVAPRRPTTVKITQYFAKKYGFNLYSLTTDEFNRGNIKISQKKPIQQFSFNNTANNEKSDTTLSITILSPGYYAIAATVNDSVSKSQISTFTCTSFYPILISGSDPNAFLITDFTTGAPVSNISVTEKNNKDVLRTLGKSDKKGILKFKGAKTSEHIYNNYDFIFNDGRNSLRFPGIYYMPSWQRETAPEYNIEIFCDRELYHPGDTVQWAAIATFGDKIGEAKVCKSLKLRVGFYDANNQAIDSIVLKTDALGRINGSFVTPSEGLTGDFILKVSTPFITGDINNTISYHQITVSDFKLPTFKVDSLTVSRDLPTKGSVTLGGLAITYSGMPVAGAKVEAVIWEASWWRWFSSSRKISELSAVTDAEGRFSVVVPDSVIRQSTTACFIAKYSIAATSGEVQTANKSFTTGKPYSISFDSYEVTANLDNPLKDLFSVYDADGKAIDIKLRWWINKNRTSPDPDKAIASGLCNSAAGSSIDLSDLQSGVYRLYAAPVDTALANMTKSPCTLRLYSLKKNTMPDDIPIFVPTAHYTTDENGNVEVSFGTPDDDTYIYKVIASPNSILSIDNAHYNKGFHNEKLNLPDTCTNVILRLISVKDGNVSQSNISIYRPDKREIKLEGSSMRDRLTPGSNERWTLRLTDADKHPIYGGLIATMFNAALNSLSQYQMAASLDLYKPMARLRLSTLPDYPTWSSISKKIKLLKSVTLSDPEFYPSIELSALNNYGLRIRGVAPEAKNERYSVMPGVITLGYGTVTKSMMAAASVDIEEAEDEEDLLELAPDDGGQTDKGTENFEYRDGEVLQAFWMPDLVFDKNGEALLTFTVPDANTTWSFNAFAWTGDLRSTKMVREFIASKPVMVQPNLPRFLRVGDEARVLATVYNNSDSAAVVTSTVEIFDIASGEVRSTFTSSDTIAASASAIVAASVTAPGDAAAIGYRVRSTLGRFTDGEQDFIPIVPSTSDVIESENFYLNPGEESVSVKIPKGNDMQSTLDYTANPAWNIIKELPGLAASNPSTSTGAAYRLFSAATASGLIKTYPALAKVLDEWSENPETGALTSRLSKNDELKAAVLNSTPWVQAAASDTERMARLSLLFDKSATSKAISSSIETLKKLQRADGGWSWGEWGDKSSFWATNIVLQNLGRLNAIGYMPDDKDLKNMITRAIAYCEAEIPKDVKIEGSFTFITTLFPDVKIGLRGTQIVNATVQDIIGTWKKSSTWHKSVEALILAAKGYPAVARQILTSLSEFAVDSPDKGTSFPSSGNINDYADLLYAFTRLMPESKIIDGMRQRLVVRQQTTESLGSVDPTRLIAAFVSCGSNWLDATESKTAVSIGGRQLTIEGAEQATGHIVMSLPANAAGKKLDIVRGNSEVPSYGSVISRFNRQSTEIKAASCRDLSIEKRITALRDGRWQYVDEVRLGEQIRVLLTIKAKRDLEYVTVIDERPASFEPVDQLPGWVWSAGAGFYRENRDSETRLFIDYLNKGTYQITIDMTASVAGTFTTGIATVQSQLAPSITAHSAGSRLFCE